MTWQQYKTYLETKILQEEEETYLLHPEAKKKYSPTKETELIATLTHLLQSIDNLPTYSSLQQNEDYHSLPDLELYTESGQLITWPQLFPKREETHFGKKEIESEISLSTWNILSKIFNDWTQTTTRAKRLQQQLGEDQIMGQFLMEAAISMNYELIKRKGYDQLLKGWLTEYNLLEKTEQEQLTKQKEMIAKLLTAFEEEEKNREQVSWYQKVPWTKVLWYGGGGLLIVIVCGLVWGKIRKN